MKYQSKRWSDSMIALRKCSGVNSIGFCWNNKTIRVGDDYVLTLDQFDTNENSPDGYNTRCKICVAVEQQEADLDARYKKVVAYIREQLTGQSSHRLLGVLSDEGIICWSGEGNLFEANETDKIE